MEGYQKWCYKSVTDYACWRKQSIYRIQYDYIIRRKTKQWHGHSVREAKAQTNWQLWKQLESDFSFQAEFPPTKEYYLGYLCICLTAILLLYFCCYNLRLMDRDSDYITSMPIEIPEKNECVKQTWLSTIIILLSIFTF